MNELQLQTECYKWAVNNHQELRFGNLFHVPNGGTRNKIEAGQLKASGVVPGIPDLILLNRGKCYGIEMKTSTGTLSDKQIKVHESWKQQGIEVFVIRTFEEFKELIIKIIEQ
jgi:hypothetical protein